MKNINLKTEFFLGKPNNPCDGKWHSLPMNEDELVNLLYYGESYIIADYRSDLNLIIREHDKETLVELNKVLSSGDKRLVTLYMWADQDLDFANEVLSKIDNDCYIYLEDIKNGTNDEIIEQIGEKIVEKGLLGDIPQFLIDKGYINYYNVGRDYWVGTVSHFEESTNSVFIHHNH